MLKFGHVNNSVMSKEVGAAKGLPATATAVGIAVVMQAQKTIELKEVICCCYSNE
jgi:hypothetical protein